MSITIYGRELPSAEKPRHLHSLKLGNASVVTGASSGLGRELAILFSEVGHVILSGRDSVELNTTRNLCKDPGNTTIISGDLRNSDTRSLITSYADLCGARYLICCAGEYASGFKQEQIQSVLDTNLTVTIELIYSIYSLMSARLDGTIVHINSIAGKGVSSDEPIYSASKHGMAAFLRALRLEARKKNVRVIDVFLAAMQTPMMAHRDDHAYLMPPPDVAKIIYDIGIKEPHYLQIEEFTLGRFKFL